LATVKDLLAEGIGLLKKNNIDAPKLDARLLLENTLGLDHTRLLLAESTPVPADAQTAYNDAIRRRLAGECVAYIVGHKEFWGIQLTVTSAVLVPRPDTETLVEAALQEIKQLPPAPSKQDSLSPSSSIPSSITYCLDLCTGSGAVAIALKRELPVLSITASDISKAALDVARANALRLQTDISFIQSNLFDNFPVSARFDIMVSNPPYVPTPLIDALSPEVKHEPLLALDGGNDGLLLIRKIITDAKPHLNAPGILLMEADPAQMPAIADHLRAHGYHDIKTYPDLAGNERVIRGIVN
jgi:release factor glutamine methyltransferase